MNINTWFDDVFFPTVYHRIRPQLYYDAFKQHILLRKIDSYWTFDNTRCFTFGNIYALCYTLNLKTPIHFCMFSIDSSYSTSMKDVAFYLHPKSKIYAKFSYEFSTKQIDNNLCRLIDLTLPNDAIEELKNCIINRNDDEYLSISSTIILRPKETFEKILIERDFT